LSEPDQRPEQGRSAFLRNSRARGEAFWAHNPGEAVADGSIEVLHPLAPEAHRSGYLSEVRILQISETVEQAFNLLLELDRHDPQ
jgi:hypothetical protein